MFLLLHRELSTEKGTVGYRYRISGTDTGTVPVQMWTVPNPMRRAASVF